jgi:predicted nucleic acid-binding protein
VRQPNAALPAEVQPRELIDTDVLIDVQRGFGAAADWFATDPEVGVPGFVVMELVQDARNSDEVQKALALVDGLEVVWPSDAECQTALEEFSTLHLSHGLGLLDALIAATAVGHGGVLNTFNERHYRMFPGLTTVRPYRR